MKKDLNKMRVQTRLENKIGKCCSYLHIRIHTILRILTFCFSCWPIFFGLLFAFQCFCDVYVIKHFQLFLSFYRLFSVLFYILKST